MAADPLDAIQKTYLMLDQQFDDIYAKCTSDAQRQELRALLASARDAYFAAAAKRREDNNATVQKFLDELTTTNDQISAQLSTLKDVVAFLNLCTQAVKLAGALASLAAVA